MGLVALKVRDLVPVAMVAAMAVALWPYGPAVERAPGGDPSWTRRIETERPEVVLLGNSILDTAVDADAFGGASGARALKLWSGGAASAWWYVVMKNVVTGHPQRPRVAIVCFRDHYLTEPAFRTRGDYKLEIDLFAGRDESRLDSLAYGTDIGSRLLRRRDALKADVERTVKRVALGVVPGISSIGAEWAAHNVFHENNMVSELVGRAQRRAESAPEASRYDFERVVSASFLPDILALARRGGVRPVLVRMKRRPGPDGTVAQSSDLRAYVSALATYLKDEGIAFLDFTEDERIRPEHYAEGDHYNEAGKQIFTRILVEALRREGVLPPGPP
jgi:hypothetical protein